MKFSVLVFGLLVGAVAARPDVSVCEVCPSIVGFLEKMTKVLENAGLDASQIVQQLKPVAEKFYDKMPFVGQDAKDKCRQIVDEKIPQIVQDVQSQKPTAEICFQLFECPMAVIETNALVEQSNDARSMSSMVKKALCKVCPSIVTQLQTVEDILTGKEEFINPAEIAQQLQPYGQKICDGLPLTQHLHDVCRQQVDTNLPAIVLGIVNNEKPDRICAGVFGCSSSERFAFLAQRALITTTPGRPMTTTRRPVTFSTTRRPPPPPFTTTTRWPRFALNVFKPHGQNGVLCNACQKASQLVESQLKDPAFQEQVQQSLQAVCVKIPSGELQTKCSQGVQQLVPQFVQQLADFFNADKLCGKICQGSALITQLETLLRGGKLCDTCKNVVGKVYNHAQEALPLLLQQAEAFCAQLPGDVSQQCQQAIEQVGQQLFDPLMTVLSDPEGTCTKAHLCKADTQLSLRFLRRYPLENGQTATACGVCKRFFTFVVSEVSRPEVVGKLDAYGELLCGAFPGKIQEKCIAAMQEYIPQGIGALTAALDPNTICPTVASDC